MPTRPASTRAAARPPAAAARPGGDDARLRRVSRRRPPSPTRSAVTDGTLGLAPGLFGRRPPVERERAPTPRPNRGPLEAEAAYLQRLVEGLARCASPGEQVGRVAGGWREVPPRNARPPARRFEPARINAPQASFLLSNARVASFLNEW